MTILQMLCKPHQPPAEDYLPRCAGQNHKRLVTTLLVLIAIFFFFFTSYYLQTDL